MTEGETFHPPEVKFSAKEAYGVELPEVKVVSVYGEDYLGKQAKRPDGIQYEADYDDILAGPHLDPLLPDSLISKQDSRFPTAQDVFTKFTSEHPTLKKKALANPVDQSKILKEYESIGKTVYQMEFCKTDARKGKKPMKGKKKEYVKLPNDWKTPLSVQRSSYRDLPMLQNHGLLSFEWGAEPVLPPPHSVGFTKEEHVILETTTGETDYQETMGNFGRDILKEAFFGEIKPLPSEFRPPPQNL